MPFHLLLFGCHFPTANVPIATIAGVWSHPRFVVMHFREEHAVYCNKFTTSAEEEDLMPTETNDKVLKVKLDVEA